MSLDVFKQADGRYRWVIRSSSGYRDRDGEIVSTKALEDDCARADAGGDYGPLRWWHMKGADIGDCDFNAMHGRVLVESGTFRDPRIAEAIKTHADALAVSIGFVHPPDQPDAAGTYHTIRRFERSILPRDHASNLLAGIDAVTKEQDMRKNKVAALKELVGDEAAEAVLAQADTVQKEADAAGIVFKSSDMPTDVRPDADAQSDEEKPEDEDEKPKAEAPVTKEETPAAAAAAAAPGPQTIGQLSVDQFGAMLGRAFEAAVAPLVQATKELRDGLTPLGAAAGAIEALDKRVKDLEGDVPAAARGFVASKEASGIGEALKEALKDASEVPQGDPVVEWMLKSIRR